MEVVDDDAEGVVGVAGGPEGGGADEGVEEGGGKARGHTVGQEPGPGDG